MKAKTLLFAIVTLLITNTQIMAQNNGKRILVAYFSATGTTARAAEKLADITGGECYAITPARSYTSADLNWNDRRSRSSVEMNDPKSRPALAGWWNLAPRVINTFIENHDPKGKTIVPFATSGGSGIDHSVKSLKAEYPELNWAEGKLLNSLGEASIRQWAERVAPGVK